MSTICYSLQRMEFAVIKAGGKQYRVSKGDVIRIEKMKDVTEVGQKVVFDQVLLVDNGKDTTIGMPVIDGASVTAEVSKIGRADKVMVVKYLQKSRYHKKNGHRQPFIEVKITAIK